MKWEGNRESDNVEDVRSSGGGGGGFPIGGRGISIGTIVIALVGSYFLGVSPLTLLGILSGGGSAQQQQQVPQQAQPVLHATADRADNQQAAQPVRLAPDGSVQQQQPM